MNGTTSTSDNLCAIYVDMGTTNTRGWLMRGDLVLARARKSVGVRDSARDRTPARLKAALKQIIFELRNQSIDLEDSAPTCIVAAGMISSALGLAEVPHVSAPVNATEIAQVARYFNFPEITALPIMLVPGVRSGTNDASLESLDNLDVMRGEETLCCGLLQTGRLKPPAVVLNLGSHWKAIRLDTEGRIQSSTTSLAGELIRAARTQTILASSVAADLPERLTLEWIEAGMAEQRRSGLSRALFAVRLLELANQGTAAERFSFMVGAFISSDLDGLIVKEMFSDPRSVVISGSAVIAEAWRQVLQKLSIPVVVLTADETEASLLAGLRSILIQSSEHVKCL